MHGCIIHSFLFSICFLLELTHFKERRIAQFRKNLVEIADLEQKHAKVRGFFCRKTVIERVEKMVKYILPRYIFHDGFF